MRGALGQIRAAGWGVGLLCLCLPVLARAQAPYASGFPVQVFSEVSRSIVAVDLLFTFDVEVYASPPTAEEARRVVEAVRAARLADWSGGLEVVEQEPLHAPTNPPGGDPLVLTRRFLLRATRPGRYQVPPLHFQRGAETFTTSVHHVAAYRVGRDFFGAGHAIFPIEAEYADREHGRRYMRTGSAFLVAPDAVVTSLHVVLDARRVRITLPGGKVVTTRKAWVLDPVRDIAVLHVDRRAVVRAGLVPLSLAPVRDAVRAPGGEHTAQAVTFTYGWPGRAQRSTAGLRYRGLTLQPDESVWISSNPVRPGDSGGPLLDPRGRVLGVVTSGAVYSGRPDALREEVCIALDPRPALALRQQAHSPRSLRRLMRDPAFANSPHVEAIRLTTLLTNGHRPIPGLDDALAHLEGTRVQDPDDARLHFLRGLIYQMLGTSRHAADAYRTSLNAYDGHFLAAYMLGMHHSRRREYATAERFFRQARQYAPAAHIAAYGLARSLMGRLRYEEAVPLLRSVIAHDPTYAPAYFDLALCAVARGDEPRARQLLEKLHGLNSASARRLRRVLRNPVLQPRVLHELPRADLPPFEAPAGNRGPT